jgi:hypothetical protein
MCYIRSSIILCTRAAALAVFTAVFILSPTESRPLHRYVTVDTTTNSETIITYALAADFTGVYINGSGDVTNDSIPCGECSSIASQLSKDNGVCYFHDIPSELKLCACGKNYMLCKQAML